GGHVVKAGGGDPAAREGAGGGGQDLLAAGGPAQAHARRGHYCCGGNRQRLRAIIPRHCLYFYVHNALSMLEYISRPRLSQLHGGTRDEIVSKHSTIEGVGQP